LLTENLKAFYRRFCSMVWFLFALSPITKSCMLGGLGFILRCCVVWLWVVFLGFVGVVGGFVVFGFGVGCFGFGGLVGGVGFGVLGCLVVWLVVLGGFFGLWFCVWWVLVE
jgi:hypothetical protein